MTISFVAQTTGTSATLGSAPVPAGVQAGDVAIILDSSQPGPISGSGWTAALNNASGSGGYYGSNGTVLWRQVDAAYLTANVAAAGISGSSPQNAWAMIYVRSAVVGAVSGVTISGRLNSLTYPSSAVNSILGYFSCTVNTKPNPTPPGSPDGLAKSSAGYSVSMLAVYTSGANPGGSQGGGDWEQAAFTIALQSNDVTGAKVTNFAVSPMDGGAWARWSVVAGATSYDVRVNGTTVTNVSTTYAIVTGMTNGTPGTVEVRPKNSSSTGDWVSLTLTPTPEYLLDTFDRADVAAAAAGWGTSTDSKAWSNGAGTQGISSGQALVGAAGDHAVVAGGYDVDMTMVYTSPPTTTDAGMLFRYRDASNFLMLGVINGGNVALYWNKAGALTQLWSYTNTSTVALRVIARGLYIGCYVNGGLKYQIEDTMTLSTDTKVGLRMGTTNARVDWLYAGQPTDASKPSWVYKGRDTAALDTVGAS